MPFMKPLRSDQFNNKKMYYCIMSTHCNVLLLLLMVVGNYPAVSKAGVVVSKTWKERRNPEELGPYFQGDIILTPFKFSGRLDPKFRWINKTVHYKFDPKYPQKMQKTFHLATQHISDRTCLKFIQVPDSYPNDFDHLLVSHLFGSSCFSFVGRQGGRQIISLPEACQSLGTFVHEILHAIGFHHEHARTDRDDFVRIIFENVAPGKERQFMNYDAATVTSFGVPYDYGSILHYSKTAFSKDPGRLDTIVPLRGNVNVGQRIGMSPRDAEKVNRMYDC